jgi:hypothetical protein
VEIEPAKTPSSEAKVLGVKEIPLDSAILPWVMCGSVSEDPWWFDDVEDVQRAMLDLESSLDTLFFKVIFGQLVLPRSAAEQYLAEVRGSDLAGAVAAIVGLSNAIIEGGEDKGVTRYIGPDSGGIAAMQQELRRKKGELFDVVGLHLGFGAEFSEAKEQVQISNLDPQAVLRNYSQQLGEAEAKAWALTRAWDSSVPEVAPKYPVKFRISNIYEDFKSLVLADNMQLPDGVKRLALRGIVDSLLELTNLSITPEERARLMEEIQKFEFREAIDLSGMSQPGSLDAGVRRQATDDGEGVRRSGAEREDDAE